MKIGAPVSTDEATGEARYAAACAGLLGFSTAFVGVATVEGLSLPWYEPLEHRWHMALVAPTHVSMDWYGRVGISLLAGLVLAGIVSAVARRRRVPPMVLRAAWVWALAATVLGLFLYAWTLGNRIVLPPDA